MKKYFRYIIPVMIVLFGFLAMKFLESQKKKAPKQEPKEIIKVVSTEEVTLYNVVTKVNLFGRATSSEPIMLTSEVNGTLENGDIEFKESGKFTKGELICKIDDRQAKLSLNSAKSDLLNALANVLPELKIDFENEYQVWQDYFNTLKFDTKTAKLPEVTNERVHLYLSRFNVYKLYYNVLNLEIMLDKHYFYATFDGSITRANVQAGSSVKSGTLIGEIINTSEMEIAVPVETKNIPWIDKDKPVVIRSKEFSKEWNGDITRIGSTINSSTQTVDMYVRVKNSNRDLLNNIFVEVEFQGKEVKDAFAIPSMALYNESYVYIIKDGVLQKRDVSLVRREAQRVIIKYGIQTGDTIVVEALQGVASGMLAKSKNEIVGGN